MQLAVAVTSLKGVSSMKLHRELGMTQKAAWHLMQCIRKGFMVNTGVKLPGPVEVDETYIGGLEGNKHTNIKSSMLDGVQWAKRLLWASRIERPSRFALR